jgi:hypothetical protein
LHFLKRINEGRRPMIIYKTTRINRKTEEVSHLDPVEVDEEQFYERAQLLYKYFISKFLEEEKG